MSLPVLSEENCKPRLRIGLAQRRKLQRRGRGNLRAAICLTGRAHRGSGALAVGMKAESVDRDGGGQAKRGDFFLAPVRQVERGQLPLLCCVAPHRMSVAPSREKPTADVLGLSMTLCVLPSTDTRRSMPPMGGRSTLRWATSPCRCCETSRKEEPVCLHRAAFSQVQTYLCPG